VAGAFRGYGAPQGYFAFECHTDVIAERLGLDPLGFRSSRHIRSGDPDPLAVALGEGKEGRPRNVGSCELDRCLELGARAIGWGRKRKVAWRTDAQRDPGPRKRGIGLAITMQGTAIPGDDMGGASIKLNEDGTWNLLVGATDLGTGSDTALAQIAAEVLGCEAKDILVYSSDTDMTPFDVGAYASSTTFISGGAVQVAAEAARAQLLEVAGLWWECPPSACHIEPGVAVGPAGKRASLAEVARQAMYGFGIKRQVMGTGSRVTFEAPPPFSAQFAEVEVDCETGHIYPLHLVLAVDCGTAINPQMAEGQL
jgi:putative selenate reductase molybdopterin-binding subunit